MLIKSSMETLELAYDAVNMVYKNLLNQPGQMYNKWFIKNGYGQDNAYIMAEHTDYSVRLFFTFTDTGFVYVDGYFTNGSSYDRKNITSWKFDNDEYPFEETTNHVKQVLDRFFDEGINVLRGEEVMNSRRPVKSSLENDSSDLKNKMESMSGEDISKGIKKTIRRNQKPMLGIKYNVLDQNGGVVGTPRSYEDACDLADDIDGEVVPVYSSRKPIKSSADNLPKEVYYIVVNGSRQYYEDYDEADDNLETLRAIGKGKVDGVYTETDPDEIYELYEVGYIGNSRKPIKSSTDWINRVPDGINLFLYSKDNQAKDKRYFPVGDDWGQTDRLLYAKMFTKDGIQKALAAIEPQLPEGMSIQVRDARGKVYYTYPNNLTSSRRAIKSSAQSDYDKGADYAEEQYQKYVEGGIDAEDIAAPADCSNDFFNGFNDKILEYKISSSRKPVKSSVAPDGLSFDSRIDNDDSSIVQYKVTDENVLDKVKGYLSYGEDELKPGNVFINLMYDDSDTLVAAQVVDIESSTWDLSPEECIEIFGSDIMTDANPKVGKHAVDEFMDFDVDPETVKSSFVVGKQNNGNKVYFCEDGQYYSENDYSRPSIKIFNNKSEADKIAKRSKSGFVSPLEK